MERLPQNIDWERMASKTAVAIALAAAFCADGATAYHTSLLPHAHVATARQRMSGLRGPRGGTLTPMKMSFVPDKEAIKKNFAKVPDAIVLRDPVQLTDPTTKVSLAARAFRFSPYFGGGDNSP
jgi:hypothetical protein